MAVVSPRSDSIGQHPVFYGITSSTHGPMKRATHMLQRY